MPEVILAIDQGTTGSTVLLIDHGPNIIGRGYRELEQIYPQPGWLEHDPAQIWTTVIEAIKEALAGSPVEPEDIQAIGITNQRETSIVWNCGTGRKYYNAIVWQCRRTAEICGALKEAGHEGLFIDKTGLLLDPYFSGTKLKWLFENVPGLLDEAVSGKALTGTVDSYLIWRLTRGQSHVTDVTNASRTLLMDLKTLEWDEELCSILGVPMNALPEIRGCSEIFGHTRGVPGLPDGIPIAGLAGDQQAALFGQACFTPGQAKCTYGTGAFLLMNTGDTPVPSRSGLLTTLAWKINGQATYALEGSAFVAGAAVQWLRDGLQIIESAPEIEALAGQVPDNGGVVMIPAFAGLGAPHWRAEARGLISGLTRSATRAHLARATLEGIALEIVDILKAMEADSGGELVDLKVDGGAAANDLLMQIQADLLDRRIVRPRVVETTALGAAFLAGLGSGFWKNTDEITGAWKMDRTFLPQMSGDRRETILNMWREAIQKA
ncbi:MAG: glycerol kinase GlpK [Deltaproteobacteria bacterium]|nr:glycerol kinase GlpK [Deltaproteobacteria bacterium]